VVLSSNEAEACAEAAAQLRGQGLDAIGLPCDVMQRTQIEALYQQTLALRERIDVLGCNAGVAPPFGPIAAASDADWDRTMTINLRSAVWLSGLVIPGMASRRDGSVIMTASLSSVRGNKSIGLYGLSKAGLAQLARNLAVEWGPANVPVNTGLVHGVGKLYILTHSMRHPALFGDQTMYQRIDWHGNIAKALLESWFLADEIVTAVSSYEDSARELRGTSAALADVLEIADMLSMCKDSPDLIRTRLADRKAAVHLGLDADICRIGRRVGRGAGGAA
jgi:NAD(P)-dependent dehydrogenase (short-subunit alcohol dehydrogenase family)